MGLSNTILFACFLYDFDDVNFLKLNDVFTVNIYPTWIQNIFV